MGTHCFINIYEMYTDGAQPDYLPICCIVQSVDGKHAYDMALAMADAATIVNGRYDGMPAHEFNGSGRFAMTLLHALSALAENYVTLSFVKQYPDDDADLDDEDLELNIYCPMEGPVTHSAYDRPA